MPKCKRDKMTICRFGLKRNWKSFAPSEKLSGWRWIAARRACERVITTRELDEIGARVLAEHGAESAPPKVYGFPGALCISVNDEAIHGIPGERALEEGDLVKLDLVAEKDGFFADAAVTVAVGDVSAAGVGADALRGDGVPAGGKGGARGQSSVRHRPRGGERDASLRVPRAARTLRARSRADDSRVAEHSELSRSAIQDAADGGPGDYDRADSCGEHEIRRVAGRPLDDPHGGRQPFGALRAHDRDHERRSSPVDGGVGQVLGSPRPCGLPKARSQEESSRCPGLIRSFFE